MTKAEWEIMADRADQRRIHTDRALHEAAVNYVAAIEDVRQVMILASMIHDEEQAAK